ncbi:MAG: polysaccharide pyruvyl transferase family protein [Coriobacteriia bacterium]|nr:polysaccharide pyruvyl transferase family protein [Coriobacteriia bacterium]
MAKIAQIGTFDVENYGDLLFPDVLEFKLQPSLLHLFSPIGGIKPFTDNQKVYSISELDNMCTIHNYDAIIIGGGDLIRLDTDIASVYSQEVKDAISIWLLPILIGNKHNIPVMLNAPGVPFHFSSVYSPIIKQIFDVVYYGNVRDNGSKNHLNSCNVNNIKVIPDTIFNINQVYSQKILEDNFKLLQNNNVIPVKNNFIVLQCNGSFISKPSEISKLQEFMKHINNNYNLDVLLMPIGYVHNDIQILNKIYDPNNDMNYLITKKLSPFDMLSIVANSSGYVGTSMHGAITTYSYGKLIFMLSTLKLTKIQGFLELIDLQENQIFDLENIIEQFDYCYKNFNSNKLETVNRIVDVHFDNINNTICSKDKQQVSFSLYDFVINMFQQLPQAHYYKQIISCIYYDYGKGFNEHDIVFVEHEYNHNKIEYNISIPKGVKSVRIDPVEDSYIILENIKVYLESQVTEYELSSSFSFNDNKYLLTSLDPQIIIPCKNKKQLNLSANMYILHQDCLSACVSRMSQDSEVIKNQNQNIKKLNEKINLMTQEREMLYKAYSKTLRYKFAQIYHRMRPKK